MSLSVGNRLGSYEILAPIGTGGMGEVYRAHDTKLKRDVAMKLLPEEFAQDSGRMARFEREAEVLASLNHPNIAAIYGIEEGALVMELVEGESPKGPLSFEEAWKIASQISDALEYAHEKGIVHRDLKPTNVKVTPEGVVKLLDFGLAKAFTEQTEAAANPERSPTLTIGATEAGVILGTAAYMAPEQAKGKRVNKRADIWAFGVVLYELLTGDRPFKGEDVPDTLAQVLTKEPDLAKAPRKVQKLLRRCLEKDPKKRLRDIGDVRCLLEEEPQDEGLHRTRFGTFGVGSSIAAAVLLIALGVVSLIHFREAPPQKVVLRYTITALENTTNLHSFAISPDGRYLAMAVEVNGTGQLWLRPLDTLQAQPMAGTEDATYPFWSPDSRYIGFFAQGKLKKIPASGGPAQSLCSAPTGLGGTWNRADMIVFTPTLIGSAIQRVSASGGVPADVISNKGYSLFPAFLADGRHFLYVGYGLSVEQNGIYLASLDGKENRRILPEVSRVVFAAGQLLFIREKTLMVQAFDSTSGRTVGEAFPVAAPAISFSTVTSTYAQVTASETGVLLYQRGGNVAANQMAWYDRRGKLLGAIGAPGPVFDPALSPDEKSVVYRRALRASASISVWDLWLRNLARGVEQRFTTDASANVVPLWSPQGDRIGFASNRGGVYNLYQKAANGTGQDELVLASGNNRLPSQWSRDGRFIVYQELYPRTDRDILVLPMEGRKERRPVAFLHSEFNELFGQLSPDSHWMAYTSDESGQREVYVRPFPGGEFQRPISIAGGEQPRWRGDGKELFFEGADGKMMAVAVKATVGIKPLFEPGAPQPLFEVHLAQDPTDVIFQYDVTTDGKRFLLNTVVGPLSAPVINVVVNWDAGLKK
jgi:serine/threonine protein kinase